MLRRALVALAAGVTAASAAAGPPALVVTAPAAFSPNGDGVKDEVTVVITLGAEAVVTLEAEAPGGAPATLLAPTPLAAGETAVVWNGRLADGGRLPDGSYRLVAIATSAEGAPIEAEATVRIDTKPPAVSWLAVPASTRTAALPTRFRVSDAAPAATVTLRVSDRQRLGWPSGHAELPVGARARTWALKGSGGGRIQPGGYRVSLTAVDDAGNRGRSSPRALLVELPVTSRVLRRVEGAGRRVALTFDDCNDGAAWSRILSVLAARDAGATFFCLGSQIARHAAEARRTLRAGHSIGNHSWNHAYLPGLSAAQVVADARRATMAWWRLAREAPMPFYRPPYGAYDADAARGIGLAGYGRIVLWDVDPQDWRRPGSAAIAARAIGPARAGSIVLLHVLPQTAAALPEIISGLRSKGLSPVDLDDLVAAGRS